MGQSILNSVFDAECSGNAQPYVVAGRYLLLSVLGKGGMGTVYYAHDAQRMRSCALKMLRPGRPEGQLRDEFDTLSRVDHPNCVKGLELGQCEEGAFFTMEYQPGGSLADARGWSVVQVVQMGLQLLAALDHVHARQIVHRDVKPQNILLARVDDGWPPQVKLCDFGVARCVGVAQESRVGEIVGSARYLSPEQARGESADPRSDLYALGVVLYELLAGRPPVQATTGSVNSWFKAHLIQQPEPLESLAPETPVQVARVVMQLLAKDPAERYATAAQAHRDLAGWLDGTGALRPQHPPLVGARYLAQPSYVDCEGVLDSARGFVREALGGSNAAFRLLTVEGHAGTGKSSFVNQLLASAGWIDARLYVARCRPGGEAAYQPLRKLISESNMQGLLNPEFGRETLTVLEQGGRSGYPAGGGDPALQDTVPASSTAGCQLTPARLAACLLADAVRQPRVVVIDDAQWADEATLALLLSCLERFVACTADGPRLAVVLIHQPVEPDSRLARLLRQADALAQHRAVRLGPLKDDAAADFVASAMMRPRDAGVERIARGLTGGKPVLALQLAQRLRRLIRTGGMRWTGRRWSLCS